MVFENLNTSSQELITAMLYGDGWARKKKNASLEFAHSVKQKEYALWKMSLLRRFVHHGTNYRIRKPSNSNTWSKNNLIIVRVPSHHRITSVYNKMYVDGKKKITYERLSKLKPLGIAIWFMDDGNSLKRIKTRHGNISKFPRIRQLQMNTHRYSEEENNIIINWFKERYKIEFKLNEAKNKFFLRVSNRENVDSFLELIKPFIIPSMKYKIECMS